MVGPAVCSPEREPDAGLLADVSASGELPSQPHLEVFPHIVKNEKSSMWYGQFPWFVYSVNKKAFFYKNVQTLPQRSWQPICEIGVCELEACFKATGPTKLQAREMR